MNDTRLPEIWPDEEWTDAERRRFVSRLKFPPQMERAFQDDYDRKVLPGLRGGLGLLLAVFVLQGASAAAAAHGFILPVWISAAAVLLLLAATLHPRFLAWWEEGVVAVFCGLAWLLLSSGTNQAPPGSGAAGPFHANTLLLNELQIIIAGCALTRLRFFWFTAAGLTIFCLSAVIALRATGPAFGLFLGGTGIFVAPSLAALILVAYLQERGARSEFLTNVLLDRARAHEQGRRERTEGMLQILSQAIGGIVHDLGGPLTSVRTGADTLRLLDGNADKDLQDELLGIITDGALMLDYLRLSLLEQMRVLDGKPIPTHRRPVSVRSIVDAGMKYQKSRIVGGRKVTAVGEDLEIDADGLKMTTVFMNLLGNALKYSDGDVCVCWHREPDCVLCAVLDQGHTRCGISEADARRLFVAFGRLDTHAEVEGTGLGLLSVQKIVEAHGGEVFVEGCTNGRAATARFTTARGSYPSMLTEKQVAEEFRTAFAVACPVSPKQD